jgi:hypothetical protein
MCGVDRSGPPWPGFVAAGGLLEPMEEVLVDIRR